MKMYLNQKAYKIIEILAFEPKFGSSWKDDHEFIFVLIDFENYSNIETILLNTR